MWQSSGGSQYCHNQEALVAAACRAPAVTITSWREAPHRGVWHHAVACQKCGLKWGTVAETANLWKELFCSGKCGSPRACTAVYGRPADRWDIKRRPRPRSSRGGRAAALGAGCRHVCHSCSASQEQGPQGCGRARTHTQCWSHSQGLCPPLVAGLLKAISRSKIKVALAGLFFVHCILEVSPILWAR